MSRPERRLRQFEPKNIKRGFLGSGALHLLAFVALVSLPVVLYKQLERKKPPQIEVNFAFDKPAQLSGLPEPADEVEVVPPDDYEARVKEAEEEQSQLLEESWHGKPSPLTSWPVEKDWLTNPTAYEPFSNKPKVSVIDVPDTPTPQPDPPKPVIQPEPKVDPSPIPPGPPPSTLSTQRPDPVPDPKACPDPQYPLQALRRRLQGVAQILVEVDSQGKVVTARVTQTSGHGILDRAALDAVKKWTFLPALENGVAVPGATVIPIRFHFKSSGPVRAEN